jgi:hypothetical protein
MSTPFKMKGWSPFSKKTSEGKKSLKDLGPEMGAAIELRKSRKPTYREAWENMSEEDKAKH